MKIRVKFKKWGCMKFIGHLDMMRYFQKAVRRADIDIRYSEGYSAHQIMSFAAPLGVGITSDGEYFDIDVNTTESTEKSIQALNAQMVDGVEVTGFYRMMLRRLCRLLRLQTMCLASRTAMRAHIP